MSKRSDILATSTRLLTIKRDRGLSASPPPAPSPDTLDDATSCVNCGYSQHGQRQDRCPECGLVFASRLRDSTPWAASPSRSVGWWETARRVWLWDRRTRLRTSYLPITPESWSFAKWSIAGSAPLLGLALAAFKWNDQAPPSLALGFFLLQSALAAALAAMFLWGGVHGLALALRGTWRRHLRFIPSSIHYATAWWPLLSVLALLAGVFSRLMDQGEAGVLLALLPLVALATWGLWLWGSVTESEHVPNAASRIGGVALFMYVAATALLLFIPGPSRIFMAGLLDRAGASLTKLNVFGTYASNPAPNGPRTYALFIDAIPDGDESLINNQVAKLGAQDCVWVRNAECTLEQIEKAILTACRELTSRDKFILYINGHGDAHGSGSIQMANRELTSQKLTELLQKLPTTHCLVVIDSCFGGKFISALRDGSCSAVVITASDNRNLAFRSGLTEFWQALSLPKSDMDSDRRVTVDEAFWSAFRPMVEKAEKARRKDLEKAAELNRPEMTEMLAEHGFATPQLDVVGGACADDFSIPVSAPSPPAREQPKSPEPAPPDESPTPVQPPASRPHQPVPKPAPPRGKTGTDPSKPDSERAFDVPPFRLPTDH